MIAILAAVFVLVLMGVTVLGYVLVVRRAEAAGPQEPMPALLTGGADSSTPKALLIDSFRQLGEAVARSPQRQNSTQQKLWQAGYRSPAAPAILQGIRAAAAVLPGLLAGWFTFVGQRDLSSAGLAATCVAGFGYMLPDRVLRVQTGRRERTLRSALPATLDMMVLAAESGQSLDQSLAETGRQLRPVYPELASEMALVSLELRTGKSRQEALRNLSLRTTEMEVRKFATMLIDSDRFGTPLAPAMRTHAKYLRIRMRQQAQEQARKIGVKMVFPLILLIFPSVLLVTLGPAVLQMFDVMQKISNGFGK